MLMTSGIAFAAHAAPSLKTLMLAGASKGAILAGAVAPGAPAADAPTVATPSFGQRIETALVDGWNALKADGEALLEKAEQFGEQELGVVETAITNTWNTFQPKAVAQIQGYVTTAIGELGSGASIESVAESVVAKDAASGSAFLGGAVSAGLKAVVAGLIASL